MSGTALIILAAGESSRMGKPKQLLMLNGKSLLTRVIEIGNASLCNPVIVVLGAQFDVISNAICVEAVSIVKNIRWQEGMGTSVAAGILHLEQNYPEVENAVMATCDQPYLTSDVIDALVTKCCVDNCAIVASKYGVAGGRGVPALFNRRFFRELTALQGPEGARTVIQKHHEEVDSIDFPQGDIDIDTEKEWLDFLETCNIGR